MSKLEGMESGDRERLWPQLVQGFKDLSQRLKVIIVFIRDMEYFSSFFVLLLSGRFAS